MREFELLRHVFAANDRLAGRVVVPPGDDLALIELGGRELLVGVDHGTLDHGNRIIHVERLRQILKSAALVRGDCTVEV